MRRFCGCSKEAKFFSFALEQTFVGHHYYKEPSLWMFITMFSEDVKLCFTTLFNDGFFDLYPRLKVVLAEGMSGWIAQWLERLDHKYLYLNYTLPRPLKHRPSEYFRRQCWISADPWDFDLLAAKLAQDNPERGFDLLEKLVLKDERNIISHWDPLDGHGDHQFWNALYTKDKKRLLGLLLKTARMDALKEFRISWRMRELLNQEQDKDLLLPFAKAIENARIIADWTTSAKPGFWSSAFGLVQMHPRDETLSTFLKRSGKY